MEKKDTVQEQLEEKDIVDDQTEKKGTDCSFLGAEAEDCPSHREPEFVIFLSPASTLS